MAKPNLGSVMSSIVDPMLSDNYQLHFANIPGGGNSEPLLMQCQQASKPGMTIEPVDVMLFGHQIEYGGRLTFTHDLAVTYVENRMAQISTTLENWVQKIRATQSQHGDYKKDYQQDAVLTIWDQKGTKVYDYRIVNCWPTSVPEIQYDGSAANLITLQVTFKYDYMERV